MNIMDKSRLQLARFNFIHNKILNNPVKELCESTFVLYESYIKNMINSPTPVLQEEYIEILIEYSYCLLFYYKYKKCEKLMNKCCEIL
jgi:hypothetical protein